MESLPKLPLYNIAINLDLANLVQLCTVNSKYRKISQDEAFWKYKFLNEFGEVPPGIYSSYKDLYIWRKWSNLNFHRPTDYTVLLGFTDNIRQNVKKVVIGQYHIAVLKWDCTLYTGGVNNSYYYLGDREPTEIE